MSGLGPWLIARRVPRILVIALMFPAGLFGLISVASVVLTAEMRGWQVAAQDTAAALALLIGVSLIAGGDPAAIFLGAGSSWGMAILLGSLTGRYASLLLSVQVLLLAGIAGVVGFTLSVGDTTAYWQKSLVEMAAELEQMGFQLGDPQALAMLAPTMTGAVAASGVLALLLALLLGAWWGSAAGGPRLGEMFVALRLGAVVGGLAAVLGIASLAGLGQLPGNLLLVVGMGFALQGLAVIHWQARHRQWPWQVLLLVYFPLLLGPSIFALGWFLVAALGFVDNWYSLRRASGDVIK